VEVDINNSLEHELVKFLCVFAIRKGIEAQSLQKIIDKSKNTERLNSMIDTYKGYFKHDWMRPVVITEARFKKSEQKDFCYNLKTPMKKQTRRADIFILDTGEKVEIETNHKIKKEDSITVYV
jgi:sugar diacid utilization regulator